MANACQTPVIHSDPESGCSLVAAGQTGEKMNSQVEAMSKLGPALDVEDRDARHRPGVLLVSFLTCFALHPLTAAGQTVGAMTGAINGAVTDSTSAALPRVSIVISSVALMGTRTTVTNGDGLYRFPALAPGEYTLVFTLNGFTAVRREGIHVALGFTATVDVELQIATLEETVIVERSSPVIDKQSTAIGATFDARQLADLPSARSIWGIQAATPAVYVARFDLSANATAGPVSAYGTAGFNRPMVEGISVTGINPTGFTLDYGAFEEVSVGTAAHGPEWHAPGVSMQFVSKSGGNQCAWRKASSSADTAALQGSSMPSTCSTPIRSRTRTGRPGRPSCGRSASCRPASHGSV